MKPFLKWVGGKSKLIPQYKELGLIPTKINTYFEPFLGGGAMFFHLSSNNLIKRALLSDLNEDLVITYNEVKNNIDFLKEQVKVFSNFHSKEYYAWMRKNRRDDDLICTASRFIYLNKACRSGIWRVNKKGEFNTPMGEASQIIYQPNILSNSSLCLNSISTGIIKSDFTEVTHLPEPGDFVFLDPPYYQTYGGYTSKKFDEELQTELRNFCLELCKKKISFLVCNSDTSYVHGLYSHPSFKIYRVQRQGTINSNLKNRGKITELAITGNY